MGDTGPAGPAGELTQAAADARYINVAGDTMTGPLIMTPNSGVNGAAGTARSLTSKTSGSPRWELILGSQEAESSVANGSNFVLSRYNNSGAYIDSPMAISRSSGLVEFSQSITAGTGYDGDAFLNLNAKAGGYGGIVAMTGWSYRWIFGMHGDETGSGNVGSDYKIARYSDGGALLDTPFKITRSTGTVTVTRLNLPVSAAPASPIDGDIWRQDNTNTGLKIRVAGVTKTVTLS